MTRERNLSRISAWLGERQPEMVDTLRELVLLESPSHEKAACDRLCARLAGDFAALGGRVHVHRQADAGDHLQVEFDGDRERNPILLLGHYDTVYALGTLETMPWNSRDGHLYGPGVFDMKAGIVQMMFALRALRQLGELPRPVKIWLVSDEEVGSASSRSQTEGLAKQCAAVLVCEPAAGPGGAVKTARKGVGSFALKVTGVAAHSGLDFEKGHSAVLEIARQVQAISQLTDLARGITLNVGIIRGGTRTNVVPDAASAEVDLRVWRMQDGEEIERRVRALQPADPHCELEIAGGINRAPLERSAAVGELYGLARGIAHELGFELGETAVGGGSDGNFTAGVGVPTLDGLGAVGDGAHAAHEHVIAAELPRRATLLAELIRAVG